MTDTLTAERSASKTEWNLGPIIDADAHITMPYQMWKEYLPANLRDLAPQIEEGEDCDYIVFEGNRRPVMMIDNQAGREGKNFKMKGKLSEQRDVWDPAKRLADMDTDGVEAAVLFGGGPLGTLNDELYIASYEAYSRWVMDWAAADRNRLHPVGYVPMRDVDETIEHVKRLAKMGFKAINLPAYPQNKNAWKTSSAVAGLKEGEISALTGDANGELQYYNPEFDKLWATICDLDMVTTIHLGARVPRFGNKQHFLPDMPMSKLAMAEPVSIFIYNSIFERFPDLKLASVESGVGWMAWLAEYNDRTWEKQRYWTESPLKNPPSYYMDQNVYGVFLQDKIGVALRNFPGGKNIMWASDYPHSETTWPRSREIILRDFEGVPDEDTRDIIHNRAKDFFRID